MKGSGGAEVVADGVASFISLERSSLLLVVMVKDEGRFIGEGDKSSGTLSESAGKSSSWIYIKRFLQFLPIGDLLLSLEAEFGRKFQSLVVLSVLISETSENMKYVEPHLGHDNNSQVKLKLNVAFSKSRIISSHF